MSSSNAESVDPLAAKADDAPLGVHVLSEFAFCPRAGLCLFERDDEYEEREERSSLYHLPIYEQAELEHTLKKLLDQIWTILLVGLVLSAILGGLGVATGSGLFFAAVVLVLILTVCALVERARWAIPAAGYLKIWRQAKPKRPDPESTKIQDVHWCELLAAGFSPTTPQGAHVYEPWRFGGRPWRLLEYGGLRIPVFLHRTEWKGVQQQHIVRMAGYCRLIELREGGQSPYGVIVQVDTFQAWVIPHSPRAKHEFQDALLKARQAIRDSEEVNRSPAVPGAGEVCRGCPHGGLTPVGTGKPFMRHKTPLPVYPIGRPGEREYHCHCGDRFGWIPKHQDVQRLGLET